MQYEHHQILALVADLRRFSQAVIGGPHDRAAEVLLDLYDEIDRRGKLLGEAHAISKLRMAEIERYRKLLHKQPSAQLVSLLAPAEKQQPSRVNFPPFLLCWYRSATMKSINAFLFTMITLATVLAVTLTWFLLYLRG